MNEIGLSYSAILTLGAAFLCVAVPVLAVGGALLWTRRGSRSGDETALRREVARLQDEVDRLKSDNP
jgi:uncharacterized iron-regulated membrane protein